MNTTTAARRAAWDTYLTITTAVLPVLLQHPCVDPGVDAQMPLNPRLGQVVIRVRRYAPMWTDGPMLIAAAQSAVRLYRDGDRANLTALLQTMAYRLFTISGRPRPPGHHRNHGRFRPDH